MENIQQVHETIYRFLLKWRKDNPNFTFTLRKSDLGKRLSQGYWFHGNNDYIALSFWTGMDWVRKVPNISLVIYPEKQLAKIEVSVKDSLEKKEIVRDIFNSKFNLVDNDYLLILREYTAYRRNWVLDILKEFLNTEKPAIDLILGNNKRILNTKQNPKNRIDFISEKEFNSNNKRINKYRKEKGADNIPIGISSINISNFGPIKDLELGPIPDDCQWIFLTGENGAGKTSVLRAIATAVYRGNISLGPRTSIRTNYTIGLSLNKHGKKPRYRVEKPARAERNFEPLTAGFVAFGPIRLNTWEYRGFLGNSDQDPDSYFRSSYKPLFLTTGLLLDISSVYHNERIREHSLLKGKDDRLTYILQVITTICESIVDIHFGRYMKYFEVDSNGRHYQNRGSTFLELASGYRSIIAMVSHMMLHLYYQQPEVMDTAELEGIVIIDEIDLHFHPKMQRDLVVKLTEIFPRIQFIVSTHSPIPLLGAPANSLIYTVKRNAESGVYVEQLPPGISFTNLLPNNILTSPIFGFDEIIPEAHNDGSPLFTDVSFNDVVFNKMLRDKIQEISLKYSHD